jgi:PAS domain S-box-containing protein
MHSPLNASGTDVRDDTQSNPTLDRLQDRSTLLDQLLRQTPQSAAFLDGGARVVEVNPAFTQLFGYTQEECRGRRLTELIVPPESADDMFVPRHEGLLDDYVEAECNRQHKDGRRLRVLVMGLPIKRVHGLAMCVVHRDVTEQRKLETELRSLSARLMEVQETEWRHLARELHDEIGQLLTGLQSLLGRNACREANSAIQARLEEARAIIDSLFARVRCLSNDLRPAELDQCGLLPALLTYFERYFTRTGILVWAEHTGIERRFGADVETAAYRIVQEALTNCARHSGVQQVRVRVWTRAEALNLRIWDDGCGFERDAVADGRSNGLVGMQERAALLGGRLVVESKPGAGTTISAELPLSCEMPRTSYRLTNGA